jgi:glycosyltransferase involved in cell wall biosynthesis
MRLLIVTQVVDQHDPNLGFFHRWVEEFSKHVESLEVVCLREGKHALPPNTSVYSLGKERGGNTFLYGMRFYQRLWQLRGTYDAVFIHMNSEYLLLGGLYWKLKNIPSLLWHTHKSMTFIHRIGEKLVGAVATASKESYRLDSKKLHVLGHGIDTDYFIPKEKKDDGVFRIITTGRIARIKGLNTLLFAVSGIKKEGKSVEVLILGTPLTTDDQVYQEELQKKVVDENLSTTIHFVGSIPHTKILSYLQSADVFVNCSSTGSLDKAVLEAMAAGIPVLTSNDGLRSTLGSYKEGLMFPTGDSKVLKEKLLGILSLSQEEKKVLTKDLRAIVVQHHGLQALIRNILSLVS